MVDRLGVSYMTYGRVRDAYREKVDALDSVKVRRATCEATGNTEWLMDVANCAMIESRRPPHQPAHFKPTNSAESPGREWIGATRAKQRRESKTRRNEEF